MTADSPPVDYPDHMRGPKGCQDCQRSSRYGVGTDRERLICGRTQISCAFERHQTGNCGPDGRHWQPLSHVPGVD